MITLLEQEAEDYYKCKRVSSVWDNNYIEYESNDNKNSNLSLNEHLNKIELTWYNNWSSKFWYMVAINFISSKDTEEERVI